MGKSSSKLKTPRRSQSMAWNFRFSALNRNKMAPIIVVPQQQQQYHMDIGGWLELLDLSQYKQSFSNFMGVEELIYLCESDIKQLGVRNSAHRARIVSSLVALRDKYERGTSSAATTLTRKTTMRKSQRYSMSAVQDKHQKNEMPIYETLNTAETKQKQSKSLGDLIDMESTDGTSNGHGASSPNTPTQESIALKKALEWELSLDKADLRSHAWYYASIPRQRADELVEKDGDFLVRDCVSQPGNYVLSCVSNGTILHFVINKVIIQRDTVYERAQYQFEDDAYDTVPDLITYYVGSGKSISAASGARIRFPCNRTYPLSFYAAKYGISQMTNQPMVNSRGIGSPLNSPSLVNVGFSPRSSPPHTRRDIPPRLPSKKQQRSQSLTPAQPGQLLTACSMLRGSMDKYCNADDVVLDKSADTPDTLGQKFDKHVILDEKCNSADGVIQPVNGNFKNRSNIGHLSLSQRASFDSSTPNHQLHFTQSLPRVNGVNGARGAQRTNFVNARAASLTRDPSFDGTINNRSDSQKPFEEDEESLTPTEERLSLSPLPKSMRSMMSARHDSTMTVKDLPLDIAPQLNRVVSYHASGSDSGNGSGDSVQSSAANDSPTIVDGMQPQQQQQRGVIIRNPRFIPSSASSATLKSFADIDYATIESTLLAMEFSDIDQSSKFDLENFNTLLLPATENKPLDNDALNTFRMMFSETAARVIANHMSRIDIKLILGDINNDEMTKNDHHLKCSGIEVITLNHGEQFRMDLIERSQCIRLLVAITILTCSNDSERAETLHKWIQVAVDTKTALGNLYGFSNIMLGLCMSQIEKLESTWYTLRQEFTDSAFNFEAKLRPQWKNMNSCTNHLAPNTTVPHLIPYILLRNRTMSDIFDLDQPSPQSSLEAVCVTQWETNAADFGLSIIHAHFDSIRNFNNNLPLYRRNAQIVLSDCSRIDELLEDSFRTEFHLKFLWGSKGATAPPDERHTKLEQILHLMAEKFCGGGAAATPVNNGSQIG